MTKIIELNEMVLNINIFNIIKYIDKTEREK